jgi:hypothetical protein
LIHCIYSENIISAGNSRHSRLFRESIDGDRSPIFADGKCEVNIDADGRYSVQSIDGEIVFIGTGGIDEALSRINYAQPYVDVQITVGNQSFTVDEYYERFEVIDEDG